MRLPIKNILLAKKTGIIPNGLVLNLDAGNPLSYSGSGTTWADLSGFGNNGTLIGGVTSGDRALNVSSGRYITVNTVPSLLRNVDKFSYGTFVNVASIGGGGVGGLFSLGDSSNFANDIFFYIDSGFRLLAQVNNGVDGLSDSNFSSFINKWVYVLFVYDGTLSGNADRLKTFVNGVQQPCTYDYTVPSTTSSATFSQCWINGYSTANNASTLTFTGQIGLCHLYNVALTTSEILQNYNAARSLYGV